MKTNPLLFEQVPHHKNLDEVFHIHSLENICNSVFWSLIFADLVSNKIDFDTIIECGVGRGRSLITISALLQYYQGLDSFKSDITIFGMDSFEGFPEPSNEDESCRKPKKGEWSHSPSGKYKYSPDFIEEVVKTANIDFSNIKLIKGFFDKTTEELSKKDISIGILHCDGDLYHSVKDPLNNFHAKIVSGGFIVFDDFIEDDLPHADPFPGARKAYEEFMSLYGDDYRKFYSPRGNVILRKK
jgi:hypothetical protein